MFYLLVNTVLDHRFHFLTIPVSGHINNSTANIYIGRGAIAFKQGLELEQATAELASCCADLSLLEVEVRQMIQFRRANKNAPIDEQFCLGARL